MADKKESALGAVTDFAQARVLDASGASKNISKADMASVLAASMGAVKSYKLDMGGHKAAKICTIRPSKIAILRCSVVRVDGTDAADVTICFGRHETTSQTMRGAIYGYTSANISFYVLDNSIYISTPTLYMNGVVELLLGEQTDIEMLETFTPSEFTKIELNKIVNI